MERTINEDLLDSALSEIEAARTWSPRVISKLEHFIHEGTDFELFRVNPIAFGRDRNVEVEEAITLFLHAGRTGLFEVEWHLVCPMCSQYVATFSSLKHVHSGYRCATCHVEGTASLDDFIEITFTIAPSIRRIMYHDPDLLTPEQYVAEYRWSQGARFPDGTPFLQAIEGGAVCIDYVEAGETKEYLTTLRKGVITGSDVRNFGEFYAMVRGETATDVQRWDVELNDGHARYTQRELAPGPCVVVIANTGKKRAAIEVHLVDHSYMEESGDATLLFPEFLTGKQLIMNQTFRELYSTETINPTSGLGVKSVSILFTDLKGSTDLYERIGDLEAFALIQAHFDRLGAAIRKNHGIVIKTIGDAVMASFMLPHHAVAAALDILKEMDAFNAEHREEQINVKVGVHTGASIAVTLNERLDYFGQTVNIASRVEGIANANEVVLTDEVLKAPHVQELVTEFMVESGHEQLKGVHAGQLVHRVTA